ncbi:hypothetical protein L209DRAFT_685483, partial [Thermothelomyces heterothallicus CBS 203.75]
SPTMSRVMQMPPPPPLLLTKRVTSFLRANLSPLIHSAMLTTPAGSLLVHASNLPASALRRQAAVAASLWALQGPSNAGPGSTDPATASIPPGSTVRARKGGRHSAPSVTVQLDNGAVFVIRRLRCGMLFICMGGVEGAAPSGNSTTATPAPHPGSPYPGSPSQASVLSAHTTGAASTTSASTATVSAAGGSGSSNSIGGGSSSSSSSSVSLMRRHVEELARWLDERLGGLCVSEEGIGTGTGTGYHNGPGHQPHPNQQHLHPNHNNHLAGAGIGLG